MNENMIMNFLGIDPKDPEGSLIKMALDSEERCIKLMIAVLERRPDLLDKVFDSDEKAVEFINSILDSRPHLLDKLVK